MRSPTTAPERGQMCVGGDRGSRDAVCSQRRKQTLQRNPRKIQCSLQLHECGCGTEAFVCHNNRAQHPIQQRNNSSTFTPRPRLRPLGTPVVFTCPIDSAVCGLDRPQQAGKRRERGTTHRVFLQAALLEQRSRVSLSPRWCLLRAQGAAVGGCRVYSRRAAPGRRTCCRTRHRETRWQLNEKRFP